MKNDPIQVPFTVVIDQRERLPFSFQGLRADARQGRHELIVPTRVMHLETGDYQIEGCPGIAVERKSLQDAFGTLGRGRDRFERELARLNELEFAAVVVEATWPRILFDPPAFSDLNPKTFHRSVIAWVQRFPRVHWFMCGDRRLAEITAFRILERWWRDHAKE